MMSLGPGGAGPPSPPPQKIVPDGRQVVAAPVTVESGFEDADVDGLLDTSLKPLGFHS